jgi:hypothetical protein
MHLRSQSFFNYLGASRGSATILRTTIQGYFASVHLFIYFDLGFLLGFLGDVIPLLEMKDLPHGELLVELTSASENVGVALVLFEANLTDTEIEISSR